MTVIRRNILASPAARDAFIEGVRRLKREFPPGGGPSTYDTLIVWHHQAMMRMTPPWQRLRNAAHTGPAFLPWHRLFLIVLEQQLQRVLQDPQFGLPYWAWNLDGDRPANQQTQSPLWRADCMGGSGMPVATGPFAFVPNDPNGWRVWIFGTPAGGLAPVNRGLRRNLANIDARTLPTTAQVRAALDLDTYDEWPWLDGSANAFRTVIEGWQPVRPHLHNRVHVWVGGDMAPSTSPNDPVFYLNHANVDRVWAAWQLRYPASPYLPGGNAPAALRGHRLDDRLFSAFSNPPRPADMLEVSEIYQYDSFDDLL